MADNPLLEKMLDLPEFRITNLDHNEHDICIYVEKKDKPSVCPVCGVVNPRLRVHQHRQQCIRDISMQHKRVGLMVDRIKYKCMECGLTFNEPLESVPEGGRMTTRLRNLIAERSKYTNFIDLERELDISNVTIRKIFLEEIQKLPHHSEIETPRILGIDEIYIERKGKSRKQAWGVICNGEEHTVIDMLPDRNKSTIINYFSTLKCPSRVHVVTMDMWTPYRDAVYRTLPNAVVVVDKFHVVKMANEALDSYRKDLKATIPKEVAKELKSNRYLLLKREEQIKDYPNRKNLEDWFQKFPNLKIAYLLKEALFKLYDCATKPEAMWYYDKWKQLIPEDMELFKNIADTIDNWYDEIFNFFDYRYTNAYVEGINSTIRAIEKQCRGCDFDVLRAKVMYCINRKKEYPETPSFGTTTRSFFTADMLRMPEIKDYGVSFEAILRAIRDGKL